MRAWPLHVVFATILAGSLAAKERAADMLVDVDNLDREMAVARVAWSQGLVFRENGTVAGSLPALVFDAPGCSGAVRVVPRVSFDFDPFVQSAHEQGDVVRYVYIDGSWENPHRVAFSIERMKYAVLATFGLTRYVPSGHMLLVESPPECQTVDAIDWRNVWNRDYTGLTEATTDAATR
jgi:hypothetical protein